MRNYSKWTDEHIRLLRENYLDLGAYGCSAIIQGKSFVSCKHMAQKLKLKTNFKPTRFHEIKRFENLFEKTDSCWLWKWVKDRDGYAVYRHDRVNHRANRYSYEKYIGPIPEGMFACHRCDVRECVNPSHLFIGTNADNLADMKNKGRASRQKGEKQAQSKLTDSAVREIRNSSLSRNELAKKYLVSKSTISLVITKKSWRHIS